MEFAYLVLVDRDGDHRIIDGPFSCEFTRGLADMLPGTAIVRPNGDYETNAGMTEAQLVSVAHVINFVLI